jgi:hypothetical protein
MISVGKEIEVDLKDALIRVCTGGKVYNRSTFDGIGEMPVASHINKTPGPYP